MNQFQNKQLWNTFSIHLWKDTSSKTFTRKWSARLSKLAGGRRLWGSRGRHFSSWNSTTGHACPTCRSLWTRQPRGSTRVRKHWQARHSWSRGCSKSRRPKDRMWNCTPRVWKCVAVRTRSTLWARAGWPWRLSGPSRTWGSGPTSSAQSRGCAMHSRSPPTNSSTAMDSCRCTRPSSPHPTARVRVSCSRSRL